MTDWKRVIDLEEPFANGQMDVIGSICFQEGVPRHICEAMIDAAAAEDEDAFNYALSDLYDWADENEVWVKTIF